MTADPSLDLLSREELVERARGLGAQRPEVMTRVELRDEIVRLSEPDPAARRKLRGWLGVARELVASVVDAGLKLPGAASAIRGDARPADETTGPPPVATLTLAEIYLAQGHVDRARAVLDEVLVAEPEHAAALALRQRLDEDRPAVDALRASLAERTPLVSPLEESAPVAERSPMVASFADTAPLVELVPPFVVPAPEPTPFPEREAATAEGPGPAPDSEPMAGPLESTPPSLPIPTLAAPSPRELPWLEPVAEAPACAISQQASGVEALYRIAAAAPGVTLRLAWFVPGRTGPAQRTLDVPLDPAKQRVALPSVDSAAHVRAALGLAAGGAFRPLAVAWVYRVGSDGVSVAFAAPGPEPVALRAQLGRA